jgi:hypothetical protein
MMASNYIPYCFCLGATMSSKSNIFLALSSAPDSQIADTVTPRLKALGEQEIVKSDQLLDIIDDCVYYSLASEFAITMMNKVWIDMLKDEGITEEQARVAAQPRRDAKMKSM